MNKSRVNYQMETLVILSHLDDEFALVPIIKGIASYCINNVKFIYCAERNASSSLKHQRRRENLKALGVFGCKKNQIIYLNDHFIVDDLKLIEASLDIYDFINVFLKKTNIKQLITLNFEGGHPDHDALALIVQKITNKSPFITSLFVPAYNSRKTFMLPVSVFRPLAKQRNFFTKEVCPLFIWIDALKIAIAYRSERHAFIKLLPFIIYNAIFSRSIYITSTIDTESVDWTQSLSLTRYSVEILDITSKVKEL